MSITQVGAVWGGTVDFEALFRAGAGEWNRQTSALEEFMSLAGKRLSDCDAQSIIIKNTDLRKTHFLRCNLSGAEFRDVVLDDCHFVDCDLRRAKFVRADLSSATMEGCKIDRIAFEDCKNLSRINKLYTCEMMGDATATLTNSIIPWIDRIASWDRLKLVGSQNLFTPSYIGLALAVFALSVTAQYNSALEWLQQLSANQVDGGLLGAILTNLQPARASWFALLAVLTFACLSIASTLFLCCPGVVRSFSIPEWRYSLRRALFLYEAQTWRHRSVRLANAIFYFFGCLMAVSLLSFVVLKYLFFIFSNLGQ